MITVAEERLREYQDVLTITTVVGEVPLYRMIEKFLWIKTKEGELIRFILNEDQVELYKEMCLMKLEKRPIRINILKARQIGFSTFIAAVIFLKTLFKSGQSAIIIADIAEHASNLFDKYNTFYDNLDDSIKQSIPKIKSNAKELVVEHSNHQKSSIRITVTGEGAGRSGTYQYVHLSECAFWKDLKSTLAALLQTVSDNNLDSMIFLETTANGVNEYKEKWDKDSGGNDRHPFKALFFAWYNVYRNDKLYDYEKPNWLKDLQEKEHLDEGQCLWYYEKWLQFDQDLDLLRQEYPSNPIEAFITTGNSVFNVELLRIRKEEVIHLKPLRRGRFTYELKFSEDGKRITVENIKWVEQRNGAVKIYIDRELGHPYITVNDPAMGGEDFYATHVFDNYTGKQCAVYHQNKVDADEAAYQMYCLSWYYGGDANVMITGETNTTSYLLEMCHRMGYRNIYQDQDVEEIGTRYINKYGYKTKQNNRQYMIDLFRIAFRDNPKIIYDYETLCEMEAFQIVLHANGKEKAEASGGAHDDLVMSACGFYLCRGQMRAYPKVDVKTKAKTLEELEVIIDERNNRRRKEQVRSVYQIWD